MNAYLIGLHNLMTLSYRIMCYEQMYHGKENRFVYNDRCDSPASLHAWRLPWWRMGGREQNFIFSHPINCWRMTKKIIQSEIVPAKCTYWNPRPRLCFPRAFNLNFRPRKRYFTKIKGDGLLHYLFLKLMHDRNANNRK